MVVAERVLVADWLVEQHVIALAAFDWLVDRFVFVVAVVELVEKEDSVAVAVRLQTRQSQNCWKY